MLRERDFSALAKPANLPNSAIFLEQVIFFMHICICLFVLF